MSTPEWNWEYDECERCGDFATHRLYWGDELLHRYCDACSNQVAAEHARFWHAVETAAETPADGPLSEVTPADLIGL